VTANPRVRMFTMTTAMGAGRDVGRYLMGMGHKDVAYISPFHKMQWSRRRCDGVKEIFDAAGKGHSVKTFTIDKSEYNDFYADGKAHANLPRLTKFYADWAGKAPHEIVWSMKPWIDEAFGQFAGWGEVYLKLKPLFKKAHADKKITAWVLCNDMVSLMAQDFLLRARVDIPRQISLISFDDTLKGLVHGLTTYNFNVHAVVNAMLTHVLSGKLPLGASRRKRVEIAGMIVARRTTGPAA
jgi:DNA-binding LacI/PurR family transcriptional regulator